MSFRSLRAKLIILFVFLLPAFAFADTATCDLSTGSVQTQEQLSCRISHFNAKARPYAKRPVCVLVSPRNAIPENIPPLLGKKDNTLYPPETLDRLQSDSGQLFIALQGDMINPDFYIIGSATFVENYVSFTFKNESDPCAPFLTPLGISNLDVRRVKKPGLVSMIRMSEMGYAVSDVVVIRAPWGQEQTKPAHHDAYIALSSNGDLYMVNAEPSGLPLNYELAQPAPDGK